MFGSTVLDVFMKEYRGRSENYYVSQQRHTVWAYSHIFSFVSDMPLTRDWSLSTNKRQHPIPFSSDKISSVTWCIDMNHLSLISPLTLFIKMTVYLSLTSQVAFRCIQVDVTDTIRCFISCEKSSVMIDYFVRTIQAIIVFTLTCDPKHQIGWIESLRGWCSFARHPKTQTHWGFKWDLATLKRSIFAEYQASFRGKKCINTCCTHTLTHIYSGRILCQEPIKTLSYTVSLNYVHPEGKLCTTQFERLSYNGRTSLVLCKPQSGRTHQIRVHLRYLGYPIANDPIYGYSTAWSDRLLPSASTFTDPQRLDSVLNTMIETAPYDYMDDDPTNTTLPRCVQCHVPITDTDPLPAQLALWLHAYRYAGNGWSYTTRQLPAWASESYKEDAIIIPASF